jgi:hypothetical protein
MPLESILMGLAAIIAVGLIGWLAITLNSPVVARRIKKLDPAIIVYEKTSGRIY